MKDGSVFVRRRLVVRRAEDSFLREMYGITAEKEDKRKGRLDEGRRERKIDMLHSTSTSEMARIP